MDQRDVLQLLLAVDGDVYQQRTVSIVLPATMFSCSLNDTTVELSVVPLPALLDPAAVKAPLVVVSSSAASLVRWHPILVSPLL